MKFSSVSARNELLDEGLASDFLDAGRGVIVTARDGGNSSAKLCTAGDTTTLAIVETQMTQQ